LMLHQTRYRLRAGESIRVDAPPETLDFLVHARTRRVEIDGKEARGIVVGPNRTGDQIVLAASLRMKPGEYAVKLTAVADVGEERVTSLAVVLDPMEPVPLTATQPPVILLNGWQFNLSSSCPPSTPPSTAGDETFGTLAYDLQQYDNVPVVYWFDNCVEDPNAPIEDLGNDLGQVLDLIRYTNGALVPQVDLIAHSMGGLIVRSYLAGQQTTSGVFNPPNNPTVRKAVFVATPHFGSFLAINPLADVLFALGNQTNEMKPGSTFLWNLATWNQWGDDLRGVDALAIIGNSKCCTLGPLFEPNGSTNAGDGVVSLSSASLGFSRDQSRTRILKYCHTDDVPGCSGAGIANVTEAPETGSIILSFLANTSSWMSIGGTPATDPYLSEYGGMVVSDLSSSNQYITPSSVSWGTIALNQGGAGDLFYKDFVNGTGTFNFGTSTCGPYTEPTGFYLAVRCKLSPSVYSVGPLLSGAGKVVQAGGTITINGSGFGSQQCSGCQVVAAPPGSTTGYILPVSSWSNGAISASFLPATMPNLSTPGLVTIYVELSSSAWDSINIVAAPASSISVAPFSLQFAYVVGSTIPATQFIQVTNSNGGPLTWSAATNASWLSVAPASGTAPSTLSVLVSPASLGAGTYTGTVQISATGASNSPVGVTVTLTVAQAAPRLAVSPQALTFNYTLGSSAPATQGISITNTGGGTLSWTASSSTTWIGLSPASGTAPATLSVSVDPATFAAGTYTASVQITATGPTGSPASVGVTLVVQAPAPVLTVALSTAGQVEPFAAQSIVTAYGTNLATGTATASLPLPTFLDGTTVTVTDSAGVARLASLFYVSPTQVDFEIPAGVATGTATVSIENQNRTTQTATIQIANISPGLFQLNAPLGLVAAWVLPVISGTQQPLQPVYQVASGSVIPLPISLGPSTQQVYLEMYGTGIRNANSVTVTVGGLGVPVLFVGAAPGYAGEDQVNIGPLPESLAGKGSVNILLTADGQAANTVNVTIQ
jgi:uncharacterized protein (TIGR03437 family)